MPDLMPMMLNLFEVGQNGKVGRVGVGNGNKIGFDPLVGSFGVLQGKYAEPI